MEDSSSSKRGRDDDADEPHVGTPEAKRLRPDIFLDILDDDESDGVDRDPAVQDLDSVMKSLEEEIGLPASVTPSLPSPPSAGQPDLGFLLEASDDELGLPPTMPSSSSEEDGGEAEVVAGEVEDGGLGGENWGFDDDFYDGGLGFGIRPEEDGVVVDGELFDFSGDGSGPFDLGDFSWRAESMPAV